MMGWYSSLGGARVIFFFTISAIYEASSIITLKTGSLQENFVVCVCSVDLIIFSILKGGMGICARARGQKSSLNSSSQKRWGRYNIKTVFGILRISSLKYMYRSFFVPRVRTRGHALRFKLMVISFAFFAKKSSSFFFLPPLPLSMDICCGLETPRLV